MDGQHDERISAHQSVWTGCRFATNYSSRCEHVLRTNHENKKVHSTRLKKEHMGWECAPLAHINFDWSWDNHVSFDNFVEEKNDFRQLKLHCAPKDPVTFIRQNNVQHIIPMANI